jgi:type II secretory pathway pseudopilin PulG
MKLFNESGFTIIELLVSTFLSAVLLFGFALAMLQFVVTFQETREFSVLQQDIFYLFDCMRHGHAVSYVSDNKQSPLICLLTAKKVNFDNNNGSIHIIPTDGDVGMRKYAKYTLDNKGQVFLMVQNAAASRTIQIFPRKNKNINQKAENKYAITEIKYENLSAMEENVSLLKIEITAKVRHRPKKAKQTNEQDLAQNVRFVHFENTIYIGNTDKEDLDEEFEEL